MSSSININTRPIGPTPWSPPESPISPSALPIKKAIPEFSSQMMLLDLIFISNEKMVDFLDDIKAKDIKVNKLLSNQTSKIDCWCLRVTSSLETMQETFTILFEACPGLSGFLIPLIKKHLTGKP